MKQTIHALVVALLCCAGSLKAQDMIVKKDGAIVKAKITEIGEETIKYKKADNPDGPVYSISKSSVTSINYENGQVEKFENEPAEKESSSEGPASNPILDDENMKRSIEAMAKDAGEQLMRSCANGKVDNSTTEIYWDGVFKDAITHELTIPIIAKWKPKWTDGSGKWVKGKILVASDGSKRWIYQNDNGLMFSSCAKTFRLK